MRGRELMFLAAAAALAACHVHISDGNGSSAPDSNTPTGHDAQSVGGPPDAFVLGAWSTPQPIGIAATTAQEDDGTIAWNGNELIFAKVDNLANGTKHLYYASRPDVASPFGTPSLVSFATDGAHQDEAPRFSADDLTLYFGSNRAPNNGGADIWMVTRTAIGAPWGAAIRIGGLSGGTTEKWVTTCSTGYFLMVRADLNGITHPFGGLDLATPVKIAELAAATGGETGTLLTADCLTAYFASTRDGTNDLWMATRATVTAAWNAPTKLTTFSTDLKNEQDPWIAADQRTFVFASNVNGTNDLFMSTR